jgi:integrase
MFTAIIRQHQATGHPVTPATLARIRATLRAALNTAIRHGLITGNPARHVELPPARRPHAVVWTASRVAHWRATGERPPVAVWTAAQTAQFLHAIRGDRLYAAFHLIALRGLRRGEAAGLRWCDVDLDEGVAVISQQLPQYDGHMVTCPPKTSHSARVIALDHTTVAALRSHRLRQHAEQRQPGHRDSGYVFTGLGGDPLAPDRLTRHFRALAQAAGLPPVRLHDLRHGAATLAQRRGVASDATLPGKREGALPGLQQPGTAQRERQRGRQSPADLRCQDPVASGSTMRHPVRLRQIPA